MTWLMLLALHTNPALGQTVENVLVVVNDTSPDSTAIGAHYMNARGIPADHVVRLNLAVTDELSRLTYTQRIERPISRWLRQHDAHDQILYLVLTKGIPLRITGTGGRAGTLSSVDSDLTLLYRRMAGMVMRSGGRIDNPYFRPDTATASPRFSHETHDIYLVTRLDGFSREDVIALIDRGLTAGRLGQVLLDQKADAPSPADRWLSEAAEAIDDIVANVALLETTQAAATPSTDLLGYYSWGSNDTALRRRVLDITFEPGAVASTFVGTSARTFTSPPEDWEVGTWRDRGSFHAGSPEWLAGDLIQQGVTGVAGHVADPYLDGSIRPAPLFAAYLSGFNLAESFYLALPHLGWRAVIVGDPLVAPFSRPALSRQAAVPALRPETGLPEFFSDRRVALTRTSGTTTEMATLIVRGQTLLLREDQAGAAAALTDAQALGELSTGLAVRLGQLYQAADDSRRAVDQYRRVLARDPNQVAALNNLAYLLLDDGSELDEPLQLAQRAYTLSDGNALVADTLGWVHHLRGEDSTALEYLSAASASDDTTGEIHLHLAAVLHALDRPEESRNALARALSLDPSLADTPLADTLRRQVEPARSGDPR